MLSIIISALLSIGVSIAPDARLDEATKTLHENNGEVIVNTDGTYSIGWEKLGND